MALSSILAHIPPLLRDALLVAGREHAVAAALTLPLLTIVSWWTASYLTSPLRRYPGPFLAAFTNWWRFSQVRAGDYHLTIKKLHEKHGPVVRIGPNLLDLDYPELAKTLYGTDGRWRKTDFYHNNSSVINGKITYHIFSETNQHNHAAMKRPIAKYYSTSTVSKLEPLVDAVITDFCSHIDKRFAAPRKQCDFGEWIAFFSWDIVGVVSFSERFGYMDKGCDFDHTISIADQTLDYFAAVGQLPWLDFCLDKNPIVRLGPPNLNNVIRIALEHLASRVKGDDPNFNPAAPDYLQFFLDAKSANPDVVNDGVILSYILVNLIAGADTTAITIRSIFYYALRKPQVYRRLEEEVCAAGFDTTAPFSAARALPYLDAVVRESMRMHPAVCMLLERYVPEGGLVLPDGSVVPAGAAVGINPYIVGRNKSVYGEDADEFRPERWLRQAQESEQDYALRIRAWNAADLTFGGGSRVCLGRHLASLEIYKLLAILVSRYHIEMPDPNATWQVTASWFPRQKGLVCNLRRRE